MRVVRSLLAALGIALALAGAVACQAKLAGARCPCIEPSYTCVDEICVPSGEVDDADPSPDSSLDPDGGFFPDGGFIPDSGFLPDAEPELRAAD